MASRRRGSRDPTGGQRPPVAIKPGNLRLCINAFGALCALVVQVLLWSANYLFATRHLVGDESRYLNQALAIWQGHAPAPNFIWPPLQQWFLAPLVGPFGGNLWVLQIVQTLLLVASAWFLRQIWLRLDGRVLAADIAFWLLLTSPAVMAFSFYLWPEPLHLFLMLGAVWLLACHGRSLGAGALAGASVALALLTKSLLSGFCPLFLLLLLRWPVRKSHWRPAAAFVVVLLVVAGPFMWRGWQATGKPLIADSSVFNLYVGLTNQWRSDYVPAHVGQYMREYLQAGESPRQRNAVFWQRVDAEVAAEGGLLPVAWQRLQIQYFRLFNAKRTLLSMLPGRRCAGYLGSYTVPTHWIMAMQTLTRFQYLFVLVFAAFGLALWRRPKPLLWFILAFFGYQLALFLGLHVKARFLLPMLPFLSGFAASAVASVAPAAAVDGPSPLGGGRKTVVVAIALAGLLVFLACAGPWLDNSCVRSLSDL